MRKLALLATIAGASILSAPAFAFDGWHLENATTIEGKASGWDYISFDEGTNRLFLGHRAEGLQVFDPVARKVVKIIDKSPEHSSNGALLMPEFDLAIVNNEDGTIIPFKISTLEAKEAMKIAEGIDTSHYDPASKRIVVNTAGGKDGTELVVLDAPSLAKAGTIKIASSKAEGADADGKGNFYLAEQDLDKILRLDPKNLKITAEWATPGCGMPTGVAVDSANDRVIVGCRGRDSVKPSLIVMNGQDGKVVYSVEIGGGNDGVVFDPGTKRIFATNGVNANMAVLEQVDANTYKPVETLGTRAGAKVIAMDRKNQKVYSMTADGSADHAKKINTAVSPYYANTFFPNSFTVLTFSKASAK